MIKRKLHPIRQRKHFTRIGARIMAEGTGMPLQKHAYSNILKILPPKNENFR